MLPCRVEGNLSDLPLEQFGLKKYTQPEAYEDPYNKHQQYQPAWNRWPKVALNAFVAPDALVSGNVEVWDYCSVWFNCVVSARKLIRIGAFTNIQDETVITETTLPELDVDHDGSTIVGHFVTVGHRCVLKSCTIEPMCLVGMGSTLSEGSYMEEGSMLGAGSVLTPFMRVPSGELWQGNPARFARKITDDEKQDIKSSALNYAKKLRPKYNFEFNYLPWNFAYVDAERQGFEPGFKVPNGFTELP